MSYDPCLVPYFRRDWPWNNLYGHSSLIADSRRAVVSYKRKYMHEILVNHLVKLAHEKNVVRLPDSLDMTIADCDVKPQTKQNLSSDVDQETMMFGSHDRSLKYRCVSSKYIQINI